MDSFIQPSIPLSYAAPFVSTPGGPDSGWHVELTEPTIYGYINFDGYKWYAPTSNGNLGNVLTTDGAGHLSWTSFGGGPGTGTVTSVDASGGTTGLTFTGGPVSSVGVLTLGGTLGIASGGTGGTTAVAAFNALAPSQATNTGKFLTTDGTNAAWASIPSTMVYPSDGVPVSTGTAWAASIVLGTGVAAALSNNVGTTGSFALYGGALGTPTSGDFSTGTFIWPTFNQNTTGTAANVTGVVAIANGGTGQTTATAGFNALAPSQATNSGKFLTTNGTNTSWANIAQMAYPSAGIAVSTGASWNGSITPGSGVTAALGVNVGTAGAFVVNGGTLGTPASGNLANCTFPTLNQNTTGTAGNVSGVVAILNGGTGQTTANAALNALLPAQAGAGGKVLRSDGTNASWAGFASLGQSWGNFYDTTASQTIALATNSAVITYNSFDPNNSGVTVVSGSRITFAVAGNYNIQYSVQFTNSDTQIHDAYIWLRKNGTDMIASTSVYAVPNTHGGNPGHMIAAINYVISLAANDYIELAWGVESTTVYISSIPAGSNPTRPLSPGVILTATQVA